MASRAPATGLIGRFSTRARANDLLVMLFTGVVAGCGLIYEYLLAHTAGRVLGAVETVIFSMIGVMIVSMGVGAFLARTVRCPFTGFVWLEGALAALGGGSVLILGGVTAAATLLPQILAQTYGLPPDLVPQGGAVKALAAIAAYAPYFVGAVLGIVVGMEIPLLARIRQEFHAETLTHNAGTIYGADYIGAGIGAALWVAFMLAMEPARAGMLTAAVNLAIGFLFLILYRSRVRRWRLLFALHGLVAAALVMVALYGTGWARTMESLLYTDRVVYSVSTTYQRLAVTRRLADPLAPPIYNFFLNGRLQFSSDDERIYHAMLTYPALAAAGRRDKVLVIGGGDGLALRDILRWNPKEVVLLDLDAELVELFSKPKMVGGRMINRPLLELNRFAFADERVSTRFGDAFLSVDALLRDRRRFDVIIVDLPDPGHPDLSRLYSARFYAKLRQLLAGDGALAIQSTSPYYAREAFLSIGKTVAAAGFTSVEQYHQNVPSFGEWGWTIATLNGPPASVRIDRLARLPVDDGWTTRAVLKGAFAFPKGFFDGLAEIEVNRESNAAVYLYYQRGWAREQGIYRPDRISPP
jgi:spermidine synthase